MRKTKLTDWPAHVRLQIERQLATAPTVDKPIEQASIRKDGRKMNSTESLYNRTELNGCGIYEALTMRLKGGSRYTPDFITFEGSRMTCHEVKGKYRLHTQGRAVTVFKECVATFTEIIFVWAEKKDDGTFRKTVFNYKEV